MGGCGGGRVEGGWLRMAKFMVIAVTLQVSKQSTIK